MRGLSLVVESGGYFLAVVHGLLIAGASRCRARALGARASVVEARRLGSCGSWAEFRGTWDPRSGVEPCLLLWKADSLPLSRQERPGLVVFICVSLL